MLMNERQCFDCAVAEALSDDLQPKIQGKSGDPSGGVGKNKEGRLPCGLSRPNRRLGLSTRLGSAGDTG
jgi:hypothetical protein